MTDGATARLPRAVDLAALRAARRDVPLRPFEVISRAGIGDRPDGRDADRFMEGGWVWTGVEPVSLHPPIDWELESADRSRRFRLQAWVPFTPLLMRYDETGERRYLDFVLAAAADWLARYSDPATESPFAWYDVAVGWRSQRLAYVADAALRAPDIDDEVVGALVESVLVHAELLADDELVAWHSNHGFLLASGQLTLARRFPDLGLEWAGDQAEGRLRTLLSTQFAPDGGHREHSPGYHAIMLRSLIGLVDAGVVHDPELVHMREASEEALAWLVQPSGRIALFGDTEWRQADPPGAEQVVAHPALKWALSRGRAGAPPDARVHALTDTGYAVARTWEPREAGSHLALTASFHSRTHKHADDGAIVWCDRGEEIVVDGGRYGYLGRTEPGSELHRQGFWYSDPARVYAESTRAHSTVEVDGRPHPRVGVEFYGSGVGRVADEDGCLALEAVIPLGSGHRLTRVTVLRPREWLLVWDRLEPPGDEQHSYAQRFLFGPRLERRPARTAFGLRLPGAARAVVWLTSLDGAEALEPVRGQEEPELLGWMSRLEKMMEPCWTAGFRRAGAGPAGFVTLLAFGNLPPAGAANVAGAGERLDASWSGSGRRTAVAVERADGAPLRVRCQVR